MLLCEFFAERIPGALVRGITRTMLYVDGGEEFAYKKFMKGITLKLRKKILIAALSVFIACGILFCVASMMLSDKNINGFVGTAGIIRLKLSGDLYKELDSDPIKILIRQDEYELFLETYFDSADMLYYSSRAEKNNVKYKFRMSAFTGTYFVVTITAE